MRKFVGILLWVLAIPVAAQDQEVLRAAMLLGGASSEEEVDQAIVEQLEAMRGRRVRVNSNHLRASAILSDYQVAVIRDYRASSGDILSWTELSLLEGFTQADVEVLRHPTGPVTRSQDTWFLINYAIAGISGWPYDLERYGNESDMWVDWVRVYGAAQ